MERRKAVKQAAVELCRDSSTSFWSSVVRHPVSGHCSAAWHKAGRLSKLRSNALWCCSQARKVQAQAATHVHHLWSEDILCLGLALQHRASGVMSPMRLGYS